MSDVLASLEGVADEVWTLWETAAGDSGAPGGVAALATGRDTGGGAARMVIVRAADREAGALEVWTNKASSKVSQLQANPHAELLFWLPDDQLQIRARVTVEAQPGDAATWERLGEGSRLNYARSPVPGDTLDAPDAAEPQPDRSHFVVLTARVTRIDVLSLAQRPHKRAVLDADGARWVAP